MEKNSQKAMELQKMFEIFLEQQKGKSPSKDRSAELSKLYNLYIDKEDFQPGDLVVWKEGLKNKKRPAYDTPVVVINHFENPILDEKADTGSPYFREPLDLAIGHLDDDGDFIIYHVDSRRFTKAPSKE